MNDNGITPVMPVGNGNDLGGGVWIFALLILLGLYLIQSA